MQRAINYQLNKTISLFVLQAFHGMGHNGPWNGNEEKKKHVYELPSMERVKNKEVCKYLEK